MFTWKIKSIKTKNQLKSKKQYFLQHDRLFIKNQINYSLFLLWLSPEPSGNQKPTWQVFSLSFFQR